MPRHAGLAAHTPASAGMWSARGSGGGACVCVRARAHTQAICVLLWRWLRRWRASAWGVGDSDANAMGPLMPHHARRTSAARSVHCHSAVHVGSPPAHLLVPVPWVTFLTKLAKTNGAQLVKHVGFMAGRFAPFAARLTILHFTTIWVVSHCIHFIIGTPRGIPRMLEKEMPSCVELQFVKFDCSSEQDCRFNLRRWTSF